MSIINLSKEYNISTSTIYKYFKKFNLKTKNDREKSLKYYCNEHYFDNIDSQDKAYWLGFIYADGYIESNMKVFGMSLSNKDVKILKYLNNDLESSYPIKEYEIKQGYKVGNKYSRLLITNPTLVKGLNNNGVLCNKSNILKPPLFMNDNLIRHFIRGYFDGDGSVSIRIKSEKNIIADVEITSTEAVLDYFQDILLQKEIISRRYLYSKRHKNDIVSKIKIFRKNDIENLYYFLYLDSNRYLQRKKEKFDIFMSKRNKNII